METTELVVLERLFRKLTQLNIILDRAFPNLRRAAEQLYECECVNYSNSFFRERSARLEVNSGIIQTKVDCFFKTTIAYGVRCPFST